MLYIIYILTHSVIGMHSSLSVFIMSEGLILHKILKKQRIIMEKVRTEAFQMHRLHWAAD